MQRTSTIELFKEDMNFSAGHFTIFSASDRENIHGHNYNVYVAFTTSIDDKGLSFDYRYYKEKLRSLCDELDEVILIPEKSKYLQISEEGDYIIVIFGSERMCFLPRDIKKLAVTNITVEELSQWLLSHIVSDKNELKKNSINRVLVNVYSGPGQSGSAEWAV